MVAFGDASFNHASKGHVVSPRRTLIRNRLAKAHGVEVLDVREFNTSRVCSSCHSQYPLQKPTGMKVSKPHFVRRCNSITCQTIWNSRRQRGKEYQRPWKIALAWDEKTGKDPSSLAYHLRICAIYYVCARCVITCVIN